MLNRGERRNAIDKLGVTGSSPVPPTSETPASPGVFVFYSDYEKCASASLVPEIRRWQSSTSVKQGDEASQVEL